MKLFLALLLFVTLPALARDIVLFTPDGKPAANYEELVDSVNLKVGDVFVFSDGRRAELLRTLGKGGTTRIFAVKIPGHQEPLALRVPKNMRPTTNLQTGKKVDTSVFLKYTVDGYPELHEAGIPLPAIRGHHAQEYVLSDVVKFDFDGDAFFKTPKAIRPETRVKAEAALERFAEKLAGFDKIGDFKPSQIVYNIARDEWILLDWTDSHAKYIPPAWGKGETMFSPSSRFYRLAMNYTRDPKTKKIQILGPTPWQAKMLDRLDARIQKVRQGWKKPSACSVFYQHLKQAFR